jgi:hypothetical protein
MAWQVLGLLALGIKYYPETLSNVVYIGGKAIEISGVAAKALMEYAISNLANLNRPQLQYLPQRRIERIEDEVVELTSEEMYNLLNSEQPIPRNFQLIDEKK